MRDPSFTWRGARGSGPRSLPPAPHRQILLLFFSTKPLYAASSFTSVQRVPIRVRQFHIFFHVKQAVFGSAEHPVDRNGGAYHHRQCQERNIKQCVMPSLLFACLLMRHSFLLGGRLRMICGLRCGGKLRKPFRLVRRSTLHRHLRPPFRRPPHPPKRRGTCSAGAAFSLPSEASPACTSAPSSISGASGFAAVFRGASSFVCGAAAPPALSCAASPLLLFRSAAGHAQISPVKSIVFRCRHLCAFPFCSCFRVLRCLEEGLHAVRCWISSCGVFFLESGCRRLYVSVFRVFCRFAFLLPAFLMPLFFFPADQSIKPGRAKRAPALINNGSVALARRRGLGRVRRCGRRIVRLFIVASNVPKSRSPLPPGQNQQPAPPSYRPASAA